MISHIKSMNDSTTYEFVELPLNPMLSVELLFLQIPTNESLIVAGFV